MDPIDILTWGILGVLYACAIPAGAMALGRSRAKLASRVDKLENKVKGLEFELDELSAIDTEVKAKEQLSVVLYDFTKRMSGCLKFDEIASVLESFLKEDLRLSFKRGELIVLKDSNGAYDIDRIYEFSAFNSAAHHPMRQTPSYNFKELISLAIANQGGKPIKPGDLAVMPIMSEERVAALLVIEGMTEDAFEKLGIISLQLALEMKKVFLYETVEYLSIVDGLTGLYGRRYFRDRLEEEMIRAKGHRLRFSFLMADIDHFKMCNDQYGHLVGDVVLKEIGRLIKEAVREIDLVARYGGEEFSVILPDTKKEGALGVAQRIRKKIEDNIFKAYDETLKLTISIGISAYPDDGNDSNAVIDAADKAVYKAKSDGRNLVRTFQPG